MKIFQNPLVEYDDLSKGSKLKILFYCRGIESFSIPTNLYPFVREVISLSKTKARCSHSEESKSLGRLTHSVEVTIENQNLFGWCSR